jgi:hypothetical protein
MSCCIIPLSDSRSKNPSQNDTNNTQRLSTVSVVSNSTLDSQQLETSVTTSSIALDITGPRIRRATLPVEDWDFDFDETIEDRNHPSFTSVQISTSEINDYQNGLLWKMEIDQRTSTSTLSMDEGRGSSNGGLFHVCTKCKKIIRPGFAMVQFYDGRQRTWHKDCFTCTACQKALGHMNHMMFENNPYCYEDYILVAHVPKCHGCNEYIFDSSFTSAAGYFWHRDHFRCTSCDNPLFDTKYVNEHGRVYCFQCHEMNFAKVK